MRLHAYFCWLMYFSIFLVCVFNGVVLLQGLQPFSGQEALGGQREVAGSHFTYSIIFLCS